MTTQPQLTLPPINHYWKEAGGIYIGEMLGENGGPNYQLILPTDPRADLGNRVWGERGKIIKDCHHVRDGRANTQAMARAKNELAEAILELKLAEVELEKYLSELYLASQAEAYYCWAVAADQFEKCWHWTSTQYSAHSAWPQNFDDGTQDVINEDYSARVRLVRRFIPSSI
jgi:hypothetical protein